MLLSRNDNKRGQVIIINIIFLVMTIIVFIAMLPVLNEQINNARHQDSLNCASNINKCETNDGSPCYNSSKEKNSTACAMIDLYIPYIVIIVLILSASKLMANRVDSFFGAAAQPAPAYGGYGY